MARKADWTYELPLVVEEHAGLEDYAVEAADGVHAGKVIAVVEHDGQRYLAVEGGTPPLTHDRRAVPWEEIERVDHSDLAVYLRLRADDLTRLPELDPRRAIRGREAEARRVTESPDAAPAPPVPDEAPARDRPVLYLLALVFGTVGLLVVLGLLAVVGARGDLGWGFALFAVPAVLLLGSGALLYRLYRDPYVRRPRS